MAEELASRLKRFTLDALGLDLVGITTAEPLAWSGRFRDWVASGRHGEMRYLAETAETRCDPRRFLPGARSVVCVAASYHDASEPPELAPRDGRAVVARYARRKDYHRVLKRRLVRLGRCLADAVPGARWRVAVDAEPLLERELAQRAGLGWIGKNTCLINRCFGSEILLGELVTDADLPPDPPERDHCGTCKACIAACPTSAITGPRQLDGRRCISYLTIECRAPEQPDAAGVGAHLFGCDICQAVCPWNRRAPTVTRGPLACRVRLGGLRVDALAALDEAGWLELSAGTPLRRLDYRRFRRNLATVRANSLPTTAGDPV